ncbi:hypothetical protein [Arundinibacter roseus]|uniref:Esterase-like activity of phytase family protein n=1 Tax=Arundinibacter roseus TaxID=2070510 RepID=A0A4R4KMB0_9BACT|nr:hypothetical protein [Arundinibacter roseus]TDB69133.1 hypothetical protein EZE20_02005 [Arundinibacter roseus]
MVKLVYVWFALKVALCSCQSDKRENGFQKARSDYKVSKIGTLPQVANESSGLAWNERNKTFWTHNDSGGKPELYEIDYQGNLRSTWVIPSAQNVDWEDLAQAPDGTVYIGDIGNNANKRKDLAIYIARPGEPVTSKITFDYPDQKAFPPAPDELNFDCEAFFYQKNNLFLFSKNRSKTNPYVKLYQLPARPGHHSAMLLDSISINSQVTSADINPSGTRFALLTYGKILIFDITDGVINFKKPTDCIKVAKKQMEAILFVNEQDLLMTNEQQQLFLITHR